MSLIKVLQRALGYAGSFDVEAVTSVLEGRRLPSQGAMFTGFNSPPGRF